MKSAVLLLIVLMIFLEMSAQEVSIRQGNDYYRQSRFELAEAQYRMALEQAPNHPIALYNLANALQKQKKYDEAVKLMDQLASLTRESSLKSSAYYNQGVAHTKLNNLEPSIESYKNALRLNPDDKDARENLQKALLERKMNQQQNKSDQKKQDPKMSPKEADQKLKQLQQKEKDLQKNKQDKNKQQGTGQQKDW